jgi:hypothetical protein
MRPVEIEAAAYGYLEMVTAGRKIEDSRIECKATWPDDPWKAARQIAGHANAARNDWIMWLIGVDEKAQAVPGVDPEEYANWWPQVKRWFDGEPPVLLERNIQFGDITVAALYLETRSAPYVITRSTAPNFEVPWREGTETKTARRQDLVKILVPLTSAPEIDFIRIDRIGTHQKLAERIEATFYIVPRRRLIIPIHHIQVTTECSGIFENAETRVIGMEFGSRKRDLEDPGMEVIIDQPGLLRLALRTTFNHRVPPYPSPSILHHRILFRPALQEREFMLHVLLDVEEDVKYTGWATL